MSLRPHLVLNGALIAADAVGADEVVMFIGTEHRPALDAIGRAIREREGEFTLPVRLVEAPLGYVVGESSAAVHYINTGDARPTMAPPRTFEQGVGGRPTVVSNVESLAYAALIARYGPDWYRTAAVRLPPGRPNGRWKATTWLRPARLAMKRAASARPRRFSFEDDAGRNPVPGANYRQGTVTPPGGSRSPWQAFEFDARRTLQYASGHSRNE